MIQRHSIHRSGGFTLLEIIIVIIVVGVLAMLALPRLFATVEFSRSTEALNAIIAVRQAVERCYLARNGTYSGCSMSNIDLEDPANAPNAHFSYSITNQTATSFTIQATRNAIDNGDTNDWIRVTQSGTSVTRSGTGAFGGIQ